MAELDLTLWRDDVDLASTVVAAGERHERRRRLFLRVGFDDVAGVGEIDPQPHALNGDPSFDEVVRELDELTLPQFTEAVGREGEVPSWTRVARFASARPASAFAVALVEMAVLDRELRATGVSPEALWPRRYDTPVQATVSLLEAGLTWDIPTTAARVRVKTAPGRLSPDVLERVAALGRPVLVDFNCSATSGDEVLEQVAQLDPLVEIDAVEQPFAPGNLVDHALLARRLGVALSLDEGLRSARDLEHIVRYHAARVVCVKPARVGGLANARTIVLRARDLGLRPYLGGFFESPYARHVHRLLAHGCVDQPSDLGVVPTTGTDGVVLVEGGFGLEPLCRPPQI